MNALLLALACSGPEPGTTTDPDLGWTGIDTDTPTVDSYETTVPTGESFHGAVPSQPIPPPTFVATNRDGTTRTQVDLMGHPTAIWFYPAANTGG
jgi:hypothetical protein